MAALKRLGGRPSRGAGRLYLNVGHTGLDDDGFRAWVDKADVRPVYFVHDLIPVSHPQFCRPGESERHRKRMLTVLETGRGVVANSQATIDELDRFALAQGLSPPPSLGAWLGARSFQSPQKASLSRKATFVVLGTIEARKNHLLLLKIWRRLIDRLGDKAPKLHIIGRRGWEAQDVFDRLDGDASLQRHVVETNNCSDEDLATHLASARALLFPSKAEGYGLPLVEALGSGVPVIASDLRVFREIGDGVPMLIDADDDRAWEAAILDFSHPESAARAAQVQALERFRSPTWDEHFRAVEAWLRSLPPGPAARSSTR